MYIHERENWTDFKWDEQSIAMLTDEACRRQGLLYGRLAALGFDNKMQTMAENLTLNVIHSSEIEGVSINVDEVRSSVARRLGIRNAVKVSPSHYVDSVVAVMLDAIGHYDMVMSKEQLCAWQSAFFPTGYSEGMRVEVGGYRSHDEHIVSGLWGRERIHYIAPSPDRLEDEMNKFIVWFNGDLSLSMFIRSAIAHLWFVSIHPFEDGNGRLARILADMMLARGDKSEYRFYNISSQINKDKNRYYDILERTQRGDGDITEWLVWYMSKIIAAFDEADASVSAILNKTRFWLRVSGITMNDRQRSTLNLFLDGYEAKITSKNWASLNKCSKDTAIRDIQDLQAKNVLQEDCPNAKRPSYSIVYTTDDITPFFSEVEVSGCYLTAIFKGRVRIREKLVKLDEERFLSGDLRLAALLNKYCSYLMD